MSAVDVPEAVAAGVRQTGDMNDESSAVIPASGTQYTITAGDYEATIASVGATLRSLTYRGRDLVVPFEPDIVRPFFRGATLAPWPNRIVDGRYVFGGHSYEVALTEPGRGQALHGLASWLDFAPVETAESWVTLGATIEPQQGYPWRIRVETTFALGADGLTQRVKATNLSHDFAPWGTGPHPYLVAPGDLDDWTLTLPAAQVLTVTPDLLSPVGLQPVTADAERFDFREPRTLGAVMIDHAYTDLVRDRDGLVTARVTDAHGAGAAITWDSRCPWVQIHTADQPGGPDAPGHRAGLAVEPMTCAPDAFNDDSYPFDTGLGVIAPGDAHKASWRIAAVS